MSSDQRRDSRNFLYLCACFVPTRFRFGLKGNRVRVPDSPAAVTFSRGLLILCHCHGCRRDASRRYGMMGRRAIEGSQKTCKTTYTWHLRGEECGIHVCFFLANVRRGSASSPQLCMLSSTSSLTFNSSVFGVFYLTDFYQTGCTLISVSNF